MNSKNNVVLIPQGVTWTPKQLTLELTLPKKQMYWCDREGMRVFRADLDGSNVEMLHKAGEGDEDRRDARNWCVGIAVDAERRLVYRTQKGPSKGNAGRLFCAGLDIPEGETAENRTDVKVLLDKLPEPIDLDLDVKENILFLTHRGDPPFGNTISRIDMKDHSKLDKKILIKKLHEAIGLSLDEVERKMYFTDLNGSLYSANMDDGSDEKVIFPDAGELTGVVCVRG